MSWENKIIEQVFVDPKTLIPNPENWRVHPEDQSKTMEDTLTEVGWVQSVVVNKNSGNIVDGHLRVALALERKETEVPVTYVDLTEEEERKALALFDANPMLAEIDRGSYEKLVSSVETDSLWIRELMRDTAAGAVVEEEESGEESEETEVDLPEMELKPFEQYDYIVLLFRDNQAFVQACQKLKVKKSKIQMPKVDKPKVGLGRCVDGKKVLELLK